MKSFSTYLIAVCLFVLCLFEKEAKQQALEAQRLKEKSSENQSINTQKIFLPALASFQKKDAIQSQFQIAQFVSADSLNSTTPTLESL